MFGAVSADNRAANIARHERGACFAFFHFSRILLYLPEDDRDLERSLFKAFTFKR